MQLVVECSCDSGVSFDVIFGRFTVKIPPKKIIHNFAVSMHALIHLTCTLRDTPLHQ